MLEARRTGKAATRGVKLKLLADPRTQLAERNLRRAWGLGTCETYRRCPLTPS